MIPRFNMPAILAYLAPLLLCLAATGLGAMVPVDLRCEYRVDPLGIDNLEPRLSWKLVDAEQRHGQHQTGYQISPHSATTNST
jgi:alpha-L-rhamnosidase